MNGSPFYDCACITANSSCSIKPFYTSPRLFNNCKDPSLDTSTYMFTILLLHKRFDLLLVLGSVVMSPASLLYCGVRVVRHGSHRNKDSKLSSHCKYEDKQILYRPGGSRRLRFPHSRTNITRRWSVLRTGRLYAQAISLLLISIRIVSRAIRQRESNP